MIFMNHHHTPLFAVSLPQKLVMATTSISTLMDNYELTEEDCMRKVSDTDIGKIARSLHGKWKSQLPPLLGMDAIVVTNILEVPGHNMSEEDRRVAFFNEWKQQKGSDACYKILISSLLEVKRREDAESVCMILKETSSTIPLSQGSSIPVSTTSGMLRSKHPQT